MRKAHKSPYYYRLLPCHIFIYALQTICSRKLGNVVESLMYNTTSQVKTLLSSRDNSVVHANAQKGFCIDAGIRTAERKAVKGTALCTKNDAS